MIATSGEWTWVRAKQLYEVIDRRAGSNRPPLLSVSLYRGVVRRDSITTDEPRAEDLSHYKLCRAGDIVINRMSAYQGALGIAHEKGLVSPDYMVLRPSSKGDGRYLQYLFRSTYFVGQMTARLRGIGSASQGNVRTPRINADDLGGINVPLPDLEEQRRIADFLDAETKRIDKVRLARSRMQELLRLKRERVIEHLIDGQGASRALVPLKHLVESVTVGIVVTPAAWYVDDGGVPALRGVNVKPGRIDDRDLVQISHEGHLVHRKSRLRAGDLVVVRTGQAGAAAAVTEEFVGANCIDLVIVRPGAALVPRFAEYLLNSSYAKKRVAEFAVGSIQSHFNVAAMKAMPVPRHSVIDQQRIVAEIDRAIEPIDNAVQQMEKQDQLLAERRQALITAAVTGQFDVTTAQGAEA